MRSSPNRKVERDRLRLGSRLGFAYYRIRKIVLWQHNSTTRQFIGSLMRNIIVLLFTFAVAAYCQIESPERIDIERWIDEGGITATVLPEGLTDDLFQAFDGAESTALGSVTPDSVTVTLAFAEPVSLTSTVVRLSTAGAEATIEIADDVADLDAPTGSRQTLVSAKAIAAGADDSTAFEETTVGAIRLTIRKTSFAVYIAEWRLYETATYSRLIILPSPTTIKLGASMEIAAMAANERGELVPYEFGGALTFSSADPTAVSVEEGDVLQAKDTGSVLITVSNDDGSLRGATTVRVLEDFQSENDSTRVIKVAAVIDDPRLPNGQRLHEMMGWEDPYDQLDEMDDWFHYVTDSVFLIEIVEIHDEDTLFTDYDGARATPAIIQQYFSEPGWTTLNNYHNAGKIKYQYAEMIEYYDFCTKRDADSVHEIWVFGFPYEGMAETILAGENAFWWNSSPIQGTPCKNLLSISAINYERDYNGHGFGHRMESAALKAFDDQWRNRYSTTAPSDPNDWELFSQFDLQKPGEAHVGNCHFPPNGESDYDYSNTRTVYSYANNWFRYPNVDGEGEQINNAEWGYNEYGYQRWWFNHIPRYKGLNKEGKLNNWWLYFFHFETAQSLERMEAVKAQTEERSERPAGYGLAQNYPNPFNPRTTIRFSLPIASVVDLRVYNMLGEEVAAPLEGERMRAGERFVVFDASGLASGVYVYRISAGDFIQAKKMALVK
ncbi:MAG: T9SS type A sorting domain-containing protein [Ignavibacteriales bacterium]|nr:T9SS type A sorting domain-containing protein [Ignavibacteriales bacterium]